MPEIKVDVPTADGEWFAPGAFTKIIGQPTTVNYCGVRRQGILRDAVVAADGRSARITVEVPEAPGPAEQAGGRPADSSAGSGFRFAVPGPGLS